MKTEKNTQAGRSMVEILGVIAIIGVLTAGGVGGLNWGMNKYRAYRIVNGAQHKVMLANVRRKAGQGVNRYKDQIEEGIMNYGVSYDSEYTSADLGVSNGKKIVIDKISERVCEMLKDDSGLVAIRDLEPAKVLINGTLLENNPVCKDGGEANALTIVLNTNTRSMRELPEVEGSTCRFGGHTYGNNESVESCGKCVDGIIKVDESKVGNCKICKTDTWTLENKREGLRPITSGSEKDKCCVGGVLKYDDDLCPRGCVVGGNTYNDGDDIGTCKQCSNGSVVPKSGYTVPSCKVCKADGTLGTDTTCCTVGSTTYTNGATIGTCKQCSNGSVVAKSGYTLPSCKTCNVDGTLGTDTTCCTVGTTTYANGATIGTCKECSNGSVVAKSGYTLPSCKTCNADGTLGTDTTCCTVGTTTYANGATIGTCKECSNGSVIAKSGYTLPSCKTCNADGTLGTDTTCCTVGTTTYANGATIGTCKQCSNGEVVAKTGYTVPTCKVCNADGTLGDDASCDCKSPMLNAGYKYNENGSKNTFKVSGRTITYTGEMSLGSSIKSVNLDISQCDLVVKGFYHSSRSQLKVHDMDVQGTTTRAIELNQAEIIANDITFSAKGSDSYSAWAIYNYGSRITANSIKGTGIRAAIHNQGEMHVTGEIDVTANSGNGFESTGTSITTCGSIKAEGKGSGGRGIEHNGTFTAEGDVVAIGTFEGLRNNSGSFTVGGNVKAESTTSVGAILYDNVSVGGDLIALSTNHWGADARGDDVTIGGLFKATGGKGYGIYGCSNCKASSVISCLNGTCSNLCGNRGVTCTGQ